ncbi:hypothetical protein [Pedobacter nyackensis]|uniref:Uncharacterized protein n=1 Tax=Pedobacter nyackensis TaxID=475255 RepID=A0A1W2F508_9SPHI|nr:hypothetical protein [Pedobacter nyackensis]SMD17003.1 hypothetical protein SAMN04488101_12143 [Pedobacter nyackensis]
MKFKQLSSVIYVTPEGDQVFTFVKEINEKEGLFTLDFDDVKVRENELKLNTYANFSVPRSMTNAHIKAYHYDQLINRIVTFLKENHTEQHLEIYREMDTIYFETVFHAPKTPQEKKLFQEVVNKFNRIIGQVNTAIKSRFNQKIEVVLKFPFTRHHLHSIRV